MEPIRRNTFDFDLRMVLKGQDIYDVLTTALEGGFTTAWAEIVDVVRFPDADVCRFTVQDVYEPDNEATGLPSVIEASTVLLGVQNILSGVVRISDDLHAQVASLLTDDADVDAIAADCIVQAGLFGKVIYG